LGFSPGKIARGQTIQKPPETGAFVFYKLKPEPIILRNGIYPFAYCPNVPEGWESLLLEHVDPVLIKAASIIFKSPEEFRLTIAGYQSRRSNEGQDFKKVSVLAVLVEEMRQVEKLLRPANLGANQFGDMDA
jgi:hypothetical protein